MNFRGSARPLTAMIAGNPFAHFCARMFPAGELRKMLDRGVSAEQCQAWGLKREEWRAAVVLALAFHDGW
jgi:hypothetical protein